MLSMAATVFFIIRAFDAQNICILMIVYSKAAIGIAHHNMVTGRGTHQFSPVTARVKSSASALAVSLVCIADLYYGGGYSILWTLLGKKPTKEYPP